METLRWVIIIFNTIIENDKKLDLSDAIVNTLTENY